MVGQQGGKCRLWRQLGLKATSVLLSASLIVPWPLVPVATAAPTTDSTRPSVRSLTAADLFVPAEAGRIVDVVEPAAGAPQGQPLLIQIQDAHTNFSAQKNIAALLEHLAKTYGLKLIFVEGGEGDVSLSYIRAYAPTEKRRPVAERQLREGRITGPEYFELSTEHPLMLWGAESKPLYQENVQAYVAAEQARPKVASTLKRLREQVDGVASRVYNANVRKLKDAAARFDQDQDLVAYAKTLVDAAKAQAILPSAYPQLARLLLTVEQEQTLSPQQAQAEEAKLIERLAKVARPEDGRMLQQSRARHADGRATAAQYYATLERLAKTYRVEVAKPYPQLYRYTQFVKLNDRLKIQGLIEEADLLTRRLRAQLAATPAEQQLVAIEDRLNLLERLVTLELTPQEFVRYQSQSPVTSHQSLVTAWLPFLKEQGRVHKLAITVSASALDGVQELLPAFERYYELALQRDQAIRERVLAKLQETGEPLAVLVTGGFHTRHLTQLFRDAGLSSVIVTPKITQATDKARYAAILKYKNGLGPAPKTLTATRQLSEGPVRGAQNPRALEDVAREHDAADGKQDAPPGGPATPEPRTLPPGPRAEDAPKSGLPGDGTTQGVRQTRGGKSPLASRGLHRPGDSTPPLGGPSIGVKPPPIRGGGREAVGVDARQLVPFINLTLQMRGWTAEDVVREADTGRRVRLEHARVKRVPATGDILGVTVDDGQALAIIKPGSAGGRD